MFRQTKKFLFASLVCLVALSLFRTISSNAYRDNYFTRINEVFSEFAGRTPEEYAKELEEAMSKEEVYSAMVKAHPHKSVHRRTNIMTHIRQKFTLCPISMNGFSLSPLQLL